MELNIRWRHIIPQFTQAIDFYMKSLLKQTLIIASYFVLVIKETVGNVR